MYSENGQIVDVEEVREAIEQADVLTVGFRSFPERLIIDSRTSDTAGPMARVVEPVAGVEERMFWLGRNRPQFDLPQQFTFFVWPHSVRFLEETGVADALFAGVRASDGAAQLTDALDELQRLERASNRSSIDGDRWHTIWDAQGTRHGR